MIRNLKTYRSNNDKHNELVRFMKNFDLKKYPENNIVNYSSYKDDCKQAIREEKEQSKIYMKEKDTRWLDMIRLIVAI